jgi:hypothetical protein
MKTILSARIALFALAGTASALGAKDFYEQLTAATSNCGKQQTGD